MSNDYRCPKCNAPVSSKGEYCADCQLAKVRERGYIRKDHK